ncbi:MAG: hypothetical protein BA863_18295 [Desulfovibrio sp. S3730MH75]|nr:MAG: hypothetical protein BA863_18295 [Desulfovibrio sp. S3730MH75]
MSNCQHQWKMTNITYGFMIFERCSHCNDLRTYFSIDDIWDEYREGDCTWSAVVNAQTFKFDMICSKCGIIEKFDDLMGLLYCTGCLSDCKVEIMRKELEAKKTWLLVAFGNIPSALTNPIPQRKLDILTDHFNQRRDTSRSTIKIVSFDLIDKLSVCKGEFIHDISMLSLEPPEEREPLF